jgi:hypothetical protein
MENSENKRVAVTFAAIDPYIETNIVQPTEKRMMGRDIVEWGERNIYPEYLLDLSKTVSSLRSVINGTADFIVGDGQEIAPLPGTAYGPGIMNLRGDTIRSQVDSIARDYETYGGFALQVIRGLGGRPVEIHYINIRFLRSNKENTVFYYSEDWKKSRRDVITYPAFQPITPERWAELTPKERDRDAASILFVKNTTTQVYPFPVYGAAVKACETERAIDDYFLNAINNDFMGSAIVNFNNGAPSEEMQKEVTKNINEKYSGHRNAQRIVVAWNDDREHAATIVPLKTEDFGDKFQALSKHCRQQIFTAFRANPNLFGIPTESLGFSQEEYESAFRLYNRTCVKPVQTLICDTYDRIYGAPGVLKIQPFTLEETATEQTVN